MEITKLSTIYKDTFFKKKDKLLIFKIPKEIYNNNYEDAELLLDEIVKNFNKKYMVVILPTNECEFNIEVVPEEYGRHNRYLLKVKEKLHLNYLAKRNKKSNDQR